MLVGIWQQGLIENGFSELKNSTISKQVKKTVQSSQFLPGPLRGSFDADNTLLTIQGVIDATNEQRELHSQSPLHRNEKLNKAAAAKLDDMLTQQYFEHNSPQGKTPADVIKATNYEYIVVGENLALGNFKNDQLLVEAWMNSPGHRANILHASFQEIGVAARKGTFEGREVWLAVQEFGTPLSSCPQSSQSAQQQISQNRKQIEIWQADLARQKDQIETSRYKSREAYETAVREYNVLVERTNALVDSTRQLVEEYNASVNSFNQCLEKNV